MSESKVFDNNFDFMCDYSMIMLGANRGKWTVFLRNKLTSLVEAFKMPISEKGGLFNIEEQRLMSWEEIATDYTFVDDTSCTHESK